jgi:metal-responsive CopG/Arc/MetJ family transcriptional regulator
MPKKSTKTRGRWTYVNIPSELMERIDAAVNSQKFGYRSRSDFVIDAIRTRLREIGYYP